MVRAARRGRVWRARAQSVVALVVVTGWFGTLLVAAPFTSPAEAAPADPTTIGIGAPPSPGNNPTPTWTYTLPPDDPGSPTAPDPAIVPATDTATATIATTHRGACFVGTTPPTAPADYSSCTTATGTPNQYSYTPPALTTNGSYTFYVHDVETTTTTTTLYHPDGTTTTVAGSPRSTAGSDASSSPYAFDNVGPTLVFVSTPPASGTDPSPTWTFNVGADAATVVCALSDGTATSAPVSCSGTYTASLPRDGTYTLTVTAKDGLGNPTTLTSSYVLQTAAAPGVSTTTPVGQSVTPTWTFTPPAGTTPAAYSVVLTGPKGTSSPPATVTPDATTHAGSFTPTLSPADNGTWTVSVTATVSGRPSAAGTGRYVLDTVPPSVSISPAGSATPSANPTAGWTVGVTDALDPRPSVTCAVAPVPSNSPGPSCSAYMTWSAPSQGSWVLTATATDAAGNTGTASSQFVYDVAPAAPVIVTPPTGNGPTATWTVSTEATSTLTCTVAGPGGFSGTATCSPGVNQPATATLPAGPGVDGSYFLTVVSTDAGGSSSTTSTAYVLDRTPPVTPAFLAGGSSGSQNTAAVSWPFTAPEGSISCSLLHGPSPGTPGAPAPCSSPYATNLSSPGEWWVRVTATDAAGNSSSADSAHVVYDTTPPDPATVTRLSSSPTSNHTSSWALGTTETSGATFLCSWAGPGGYTSPEAVCASPYSFLLPAANGTYTLSVLVRDAAGNRSLTAITGTVLVDDIAPVVTFVNPPTTPRNDSTVTWTTTVTETGSGSVRTECRLTKKTSGADLVIENWGAQPCGRSVTRTLTNGDGLYVLQVRDTDAAGNVDPVGTTSADVELDTSAPGAPTVSGSAGFSQVPSVSWTIHPATGPTADPTATYLCRLDQDGSTSGAWVGCDTDGNPANGIVYTASLTADGAYQLDVQARDAAGNLSTPLASSGVYTLDRLAPSPPLFSGSNGTGNVSPHSWSWTGELNSTADCRLYTVAATGVRTLVNTRLGCSSPDSEPLAGPTSGTTYVLTVTLTDRAGNTNAATDGPTFVYDTVPPAAPVLHGPSATSNNRSVSYTFTAEAGSSAACRLLFAAAGTLAAPAPIGTGGFVPCTTGWSPALDQGDGRYQAEAHVTDAGGNTSPDAQSEIYTLDTTGPLPPQFLTQPTGTANGKTLTYTWSGETPSTGTCTLRYTPSGSTTTSIVDGPVACNGFAYTKTVSGDGFYQLSVQLTDPWANPGQVATSTGYTLDATPPAAPTVVGPTGPSNRTSGDYSLSSAVEPFATAECQLRRDGTVVDAWAACTLPRTIALSGDGTYVLDVRLTDQYGNTGPAGSSSGYLLDTVLPSVPVVTAPASPSSNAAPSFVIATDPDTKTTCRVMRGSVVAIDTTPCTTGFVANLAGQPDGDYVLAVTATDPAGNVATGSSSAYSFDTTKPLPPSVTGPAGPSQTRNPVFGWTGEAGARAECSLQEKAGTPGPWAGCASPYAPSLPSDGSWVLSVRLIDAAGNVSDAGASGAYVFDTTAPPPPSVTAPTSPGRDLAPSWSAVTEEGSTVECRLSGPGQLGQWGRCTLPVATPVSVDGLYTFEVRATDVAGNVSLPGSGTYLLDTTAPAAPVVVQPTGPGRSHTPSITFISEAGTTGSCRLTHGATVLSDSAACSSPATLDLTGLADGAYTLSVRAVDAAGNIGPAGTATYVLDTTAPAAPTMTLIPGSPSSDRAPVFGFNAELGTAVSCKLTTPSGAVKDLPCASPVTVDLSGSADGDYVFAVRASDAAGNAGPAATANYSLDSNAPAAPRVVGPPTPGSVRNPVWKISSSSPAECRLTRGSTVVKDWTPCATSYAADLYAQPDGAYVLEARVIGTTAATSSRYRLDTAAPAAATIVGPPSPSTDVKPTWAVSSPDTTVRAECRVLVFTGVLRDWAPCGVSPAGSLYTLDVTGLGDATYTLVVRLTDAAGNVGPTASSDYVLDTSAPPAVGVIAPLSPGNDTTPTWTLTSAAGVKLECRLTSGQKVISDFAPCTGTFTANLTGLPDATYTLTVHALSAAGTPGPDTTSGYILDTTAAGAPGTLTGPSGPSRDRAPRWTFTLAPGTTAVCHVTFGGRVYFDGPCSSPFVLDLSNAADGSYTITVRAVDAAGNLGSPSTAGYILKTSPPPPPVLTMQPGSPSSTTDPTWGFSLFRGTTAECRLLQAGAALEDWHACTSPATALLSGKPDGAYTMQVRAVDVALNTSSPISGDYTLDRSAQPLARFVDTPATPSNDTSPTWIVAAPAPVTTPSGTAALMRAAALTGTPQTECRLTTPRGAGSWQPCAGSFTATTNGDGSYLLEVRAYDDTGARGPASSSSYVLDTHAPAAPRFLDPMPPAVGNDAEVAWSWAEDADLVQCHLLRNGVTLGSFTACAPPYVASIGRLGEATYTIEARAVDAAGNIGPAASASYRYDITPPSAPTFASRPASRGAASSVTWTFPVPLDTSAVCVVTRNGTVLSEGACNGAFTIDLRGMQPSSFALSVHFVDAAGNVGPSTVGSYQLTSPVVGRVGGGGVPLGSPGGEPTGPRPAPQSGPSAAPHSSGLDALADHPRAGAITRLPAIIKKGLKTVARATTAIPGALPGTDVPKAVKNVLRQTITKPQLPLALFVIVFLFLLVQNRIDRRDPKLAVAPVSAEPELTFGPIRRTSSVLRPGGATA